MKQVISTKIHEMQSVTQGIVAMSIYVFFTVNYTMSCSFSLSKTVNVMVFYSKITWNLPLDLSQLFTVYIRKGSINNFSL